jgi:putative spermidine/putrescine transport system substrate-binding protein
LEKIFMQSGLRRRQMLGGLGGAFALGCGISAARAAETITVTAFGGVYEKAIREVIVPDFEKATGAKAQILGGQPEQWMAQVQANPAHPPIDVMMCNFDLALIAQRAGLIEKLTPQKIPNLADIPQQLLDMANSYAVIFTFGSWGFAYHERVKNPPRSFVELVDGTVAGTWRVALPNAGYTGTPQVLIWALADVLGGSADNVTPAFDAIKKMKPNASFFAGITDPLTLLESGEVDISLYPDGRTWASYDAGAKWIRFINPKEGGVNLPSLATKVKNGSDLGWAYINSLLAPGPQAEVVQRLNYGTSNPKVQLSAEFQKRITPWQQCRWAPAEKIAQYKSAWIERWNKEINA